MKGRTLSLIGGALFFGSVVAWAMTLFGSHEGGNPYWVHLSGQCAKGCIPSSLDYVYAFVSLIVPPVLAFSCMLAGRKRRMIEGRQAP